MIDNNPLKIIHNEDDKEILDEEWERFLKEKYSQVRFDVPDKHTTALFLRWRKEQK